MVPLGAVKYTILAAVLVLSVFVGIRFIFAHDMRRETWRSMVKRHVYVSQIRFKRMTIAFGWLLLLFGLSIAYFQILNLLDAK
jgi:hypothetical protein